MRIQTLSIDALPSMNRLGSYRQALLSSKHRTAIGWQIKESQIKPIEHYPIDVIVNSYFRGRLPDTTNICWQWKYIEDCLVKNGILVDDTPQYVRHLLIKQPEKVESTRSLIVCQLIEESSMTWGVVKHQG